MYKLIVIIDEKKRKKYAISEDTKDTIKESLIIQ
jgi:hypothetical protein